MSILDDDLTVPAPLHHRERQRIFIAIELGLWVCGGVGYGLKLLDVPAYPYVLLFAFGLLALFYLLCPVWLFGSAGWRRHIGSHLLGVVLSQATAAILFVLLRWPDAAEQTRTGLNLTVLASSLILIFYFFRKNSRRGGSFFLNALIRTLVMMGWMALLVR